AFRRGRAGRRRRGGRRRRAADRERRRRADRRRRGGRGVRARRVGSRAGGRRRRAGRQRRARALGGGSSRGTMAAAHPAGSGRAAAAQVPVPVSASRHRPGRQLHVAGRRGGAVVTGAVQRAARALALWLAVVTCAFAQDVEVVASVDRTEPHVNESFTYVLRAEGRVRGQPDVTPLLDLFDVLSSSESTRIQIVNGRAEQVVEWIYQLMPRQAGEVLIPPIEVAGTFSNAVEIGVIPASADADVLCDIVREVEVSPEPVCVESQVVYTLRRYIGAMTGRATITPPRITGGEAIVERLGADREYRATRGNRDFT